jgi:hypothetical protein
MYQKLKLVGSMNNTSYYPLRQKVVQQATIPYQLRLQKKLVPPPVKAQKITGTGIVSGDTGGISASDWPRLP